MPKILLVDDEAAIRNSLREILEYENYDIAEASNGKEAFMALKDGDFDLCFCDVKMPEMDGIKLLEFLSREDVSTPLIMISGHASIDNAVECVKLGAFDFIEKPLDLNRILVTARNAMEKNELIEVSNILKQKVQRRTGSKIIGNSPEILDIEAMIDKIAPTEARVLITGPNGTGKELVAQQVHGKSVRQKKAFVEVNCAAIPSELIESELFGHEKGAFTSAIKQRKGKFEIASEGTLFLDEIGDMSLGAQAKVLRALQEHKITRVGGEKDIKVNCRVLAATNKDLKKEIEEGRFREDLYHRLCVIHLKVPALKDRQGDIPLLANHFNELICKDYGLTPKVIDSKALKLLEQHEWTGNVRELRNVMERLIILSDKNITAELVEKYL
jgi:DNA-binding NtrC family response regulator